MKRFTAVLLCVALLLTLSGCNKQGPAAPVSVSTVPRTTTTTAVKAPEVVAAAIPDLTAMTKSAASTVYIQDDAGNWVEHIVLPCERAYLSLGAIPKALQNAFVAADDADFFTHNGENGDKLTLTQKLLMLTVADLTDPAVLKKTATVMEAEHYSKEQILETYLNIVPFMDTVAGVYQASRYMFGVDPDKLTLAQCATLAGITTATPAVDPYTAPDSAIALGKGLLNTMLSLNLITQDEHTAAMAEELTFQKASSEAAVWDYYTDLLFEDVIDDLSATYGYTYEYAENLVFNGGLKLYSYEHIASQRAVEAVFEDSSNFPDFRGAYSQPTAAIFIMDYEGRVVATVGDRGKKTANRVKNIGTDVRRRPGSTIKPLGVFAPALDRDIINYSTLVANRPIDLGDYLWPHNFQETIEQAQGWRTVQYALQVSLNTVPVQILTKLGAGTSFDFLTKTLHFTSPTSGDRNYAALALGGFEHGVTVREMTAGYQIFGNGGVYNKPHTYALVTDADGKELLKHTPEKEQAISPETATIMNKMLQKVVTQGTASAIDGDLPMEVFGKTGTTDGNVDSYFCGGTPHYVAALWLGYENNTGMTEGQRVVQKEIWSKCMQALHKVNGKTSGTFPMWGNVEGHYYNSSGIVTSGGGSYGYYKAGKVPYSSNSLGTYTPGKTPATTTTTTTTTVTTTPSTTVTTTGSTTATTTPTTEQTAPTTAPTTAVTTPTTEQTAPPTEATTVPTTPPTEATLPTE